MHDAFSQTYTARPTAAGLAWDDTNSTSQSPMHLLITALVHCTILTLDSILIKQRLSVARYRITVTAQQRAEHPQVWHTIALDITCLGSAFTIDNLERAMHIVPRYCPVHATVSHTATIHHTLTVGTTQTEEHP